MELFFVFFIFFFGLFWGSFLLVLADRMPQNESVLFGRSRCENCKKKLEWYELIPILSYALQKGKCRRCHSSLSLSYPATELVTGILLALSFIFFAGSSSLFYIFLFIMISILLVIFISDWKYTIIPFAMVMIGTISAAIYYFLVSPEILLPHLLIGVVSTLFFFSIYFFTKGKGMGFGDVVYAFFMGFLLGFPGVLVGLYVAFLTGAGVSLILIMLRKKKLRGDTIAFGPFLVLGTAIAFIFEKQLLSLVSRIW